MNEQDIQSALASLENKLGNVRGMVDAGDDNEKNTFGERLSVIEALTAAIREAMVQKKALETRIGLLEKDGDTLEGALGVRRSELAVARTDREKHGRLEKEYRDELKALEEARDARMQTWFDSSVMGGDIKLSDVQNSDEAKRIDELDTLVAQEHLHNYRADEKIGELEYNVEKMIADRAAIPDRIKQVRENIVQNDADCEKNINEANEKIDGLAADIALSGMLAPMDNTPAIQPAPVNQPAAEPTLKDYLDNVERRINASRRTIANGNAPNKQDLMQNASDYKKSADDIKNLLGENDLLEGKIDNLKLQKNSILAEKAAKEAEMASVLQAKEKFENERREAFNVSLRLMSMDPEHQKEYIREYAAEHEVVNDYMSDEERENILQSYEKSFSSNMEVQQTQSEERINKAEEHIERLKDRIDLLDWEDKIVSDQISGLDKNIAQNSAKYAENIQSLNFKVSFMESELGITNEQAEKDVSDGLAKYTTASRENFTHEMENVIDPLGKAAPTASQELREAGASHRDVAEMTDFERDFRNYFDGIHDTLMASLHNVYRSDGAKRRDSMEGASKNAQIAREMIQNAEKNFEDDKTAYDQKYDKAEKEKNKIKSEIEQLREQNKPVEKDIYKLDAKRQAAQDEANRLSALHKGMSDEQKSQMGFFAKWRYDREENTIRDKQGEADKLDKEISEKLKKRTDTLKAIRGKENEIKKIDKDLGVEAAKLRAKEKLIKEKIDPVKDAIAAVKRNSVTKVSAVEIKKNFGENKVQHRDYSKPRDMSAERQNNGMNRG